MKRRGPNPTKNESGQLGFPFFSAVNPAPDISLSAGRADGDGGSARRPLAMESPPREETDPMRRALYLARGLRRNRHSDETRRRHIDELCHQLLQALAADANPDRAQH
ncbi:MAG: hypothetical protein H6993_12935 [Pseudomonadales bacterium]|nr:hypothetical protein [Pseudomonadales bacterium]MCP5184864.1 hypothetical protein [Pseudomonadales bacterium]